MIECTIDFARIARKQLFRSPWRTWRCRSRRSRPLRRILRTKWARRPAPAATIPTSGSRLPTSGPSPRSRISTPRLLSTATPRPGCCAYTSRPTSTLRRSSAHAAWLDSTVGPEQPALVLHRASDRPYPVGSSFALTPRPLCPSRYGSSLHATARSR
jgi:hypothetical protein